MLYKTRKQITEERARLISIKADNVNFISSSRAYELLNKCKRDETFVKKLLWPFDIVMSSIPLD